MRKTIQINKYLLLAIYTYLCLPILIFLISWCKWYIGIPAAAVGCLSVFLCIREHGKKNVSEKFLHKQDLFKCLLIVAVIMCWVGFSGVGGYVWQNSDHWWRNAMFDVLVAEEWPVTSVVNIDGTFQSRGFVYYIGFWLPAALIGKTFGLSAGYAAQYIWAVVGILLFYALICAWRKKILIWPLLLLIFFSGADILGTLLNSEENVRVFGTEHLERWAARYQFSGMTTQLFWVFNQAVPAWLASALIFLSEKPKNLVFTWSLIMITSTLPFAGLLPYVIYFLISRSHWHKNKTIFELIKNAWENWGSVQNVLGGGTVGILSLLYLLGNGSGSKVQILSQEHRAVTYNGFATVMILSIAIGLFIALIYIITKLILCGYGRTLAIISACTVGVFGIVVGIYVLLNNQIWNTYVYKLMFLALFYLVEVGGYLICLREKINDKILYFITVIWLALIPLIIVGSSIDFCMRASIPALLLIALWCIDVIDCNTKDIVIWVLIGLLLTGSVTSLHEFKRTFVNTKEQYVLESVGQEVILNSDNFSGNTVGVFWEIIAK